MARIADDELERLKQEVSVQRLAEARGVKLKRHGADLIGLCPFHDDREPSLVVSPGKNLWHCLGACQAGGSVVDWVMRAEGVSFRHAAELLRSEHLPLAAAEHGERRVVKQSTVPKLEAFAEPDEPDSAVLGRVVSYYHRTLKQSPEALAYLHGRGLEHAEVIDHFKLGYSNRTLGYRLPQKNRHAGAALRGQLQRLGVLRESGHEHFRGSLTIPLTTGSDEVLGMYGRKIASVAELRPGTPLHLYLPGPHRGVFNVHGLAEQREVILCEALIDALSFWCAGFRNVTSAYGVEGFTAELFAALKEHHVQKVLIAYDRDEAGERAADKLAPELAAAGMSVFRVVFPRGMDASEYALKVTPASKSLGVALGAARWMAGHRAVAVTAAVQSPAMEVTEPAPAAEVIELVPPDVDEPPVAIELASAEQEAAPVSPLAAELPPPATPVASSALAALLGEDEVVMSFGPRRWRVRGLSKNSSLASIKVSVRVMVDAAFFQDQLELMSARARAAFLKQAQDELGLEERVLKGDLGRVILKLEELLEVQLRDKLTPQKPGYQMSEAEEAEALSLLRDPKLLQRILGDFDRCGVVGEETNKLVLYLATSSRKLQAPLAVVIQSSSAAGKSSLMDAVLRFMPEEEQVSYSAMTGQSLFYMGASDLQHKVLAIAEQQGAQSAGYALKLLQSAGELTIASTGKDPATGRLVTHEYRVQGPVMVMLTTTSLSVDEELLNRCMVLTVDEGREQTQAIQRLQRQSRTLVGLQRKHEQGRIMQLHQNAQRLLRPVHVINPFAEELSFADHAPRTRRDHAKYLALIDAIALVHQHQRPVKTAQIGGGELRYIEVTRDDLQLADKLAAEVLSRGLDELPPQTRSLLQELHGLVQAESARQGVSPEDYRFSRRFLRERLGWGETQLRAHLWRLEQMEYVLVHGGSRGRSFVYELCYAPDATTTELRGVFAGSSRAMGREVSSSDDEDLSDFAGCAAEVTRGDSAPLAAPH